jgi:hypothetical protein
MFDISKESINLMKDEEIFNAYGVYKDKIFKMHEQIENLNKKKEKKAGRKEKYSTMMKIIIFLSRIKQGHTFSELSRFYGVPKTTVHETVEEYLDILDNNMIFTAETSEIKEKIKKKPKLELLIQHIL